MVNESVVLQYSVMKLLTDGNCVSSHSRNGQMAVYESKNFDSIQGAIYD